MTALHTRRTFLGLAASGYIGVEAATATSTNETSTANRTSTSDSTETRTPEPTPTEPVGSHPMFGGDPARTGFAPDGRGPSGPVKARWCVGSGGHRLTTLAVSGGTVFSGSPSDGLRALDAMTGQTQWRVRLDGYPDSPSVVGDRLYTTDDGAVYALGRESGRELWSVTLGGHVSTSALVTSNGKTVFAASIEETESGERNGSRLHALDATDGTARWTAPIEDGDLYEALAVRDRLVCGGGSRHYFYAFDTDTGERRWRADLDDHATSPTIGQESVFVGDEPGTVYALDRNDGTQRWTYDVGAEIRTSPAVGNGTVYVAATDGYLYALDAETGTRTWRFDGGRRLTCSPTVVGTGDGAVVYIGSEQGNVFAVDAATGTSRWSFQLTDAVETPPVVVDEYVFVGDGDGRVRALVDESASAPAGARTCAPTQTSTAARNADEDADNDGVVDRNDYAPRDPSVQRRAERDSYEQDTLDFLSGVGVGTAVTILGFGSGWWLRSRGGPEP